MSETMGTWQELRDIWIGTELNQETRTEDREVGTGYGPLTVTEDVATPRK